MQIGDYYITINIIWRRLIFCQRARYLFTWFISQFNAPLVCKSLPWPIARRPADVSWTWRFECPAESGCSERHSPRPILASLPEDPHRTQRGSLWLPRQRSGTRKLIITSLEFIWNYSQNKLQNCFNIFKYQSNSETNLKD